MNIIVTGASRGIGYQLVKKYSANPGNTIFAVSRNASKLAMLKLECGLLNPATKVVPVTCDLSSESDIENLIATIKTHTSEINLLVNNAGAIVVKPFLELTAKDVDYVYNVNVFAVIKLTQAILPMLAETTRSHVVNISSVGGFQGSLKFAGLSSYSSSKAALASLTECLAEEFKEKNIAFNCLALGAVQTEMLNEAFPGYQAPLSAEGMAQYISEFSLSAHKYMNGKIIPVSMSNP